MNRNSARLRNARTSVTLVRMLGAAGPVDDQPEQRGGARDDEQKAVAQILQFPGAERELKSLQRAGRDAELAVAVGHPIHGAQEQIQRPFMGDAAVVEKI